ncbi:hypothetical protein [Burkholderia pseudomallei]|jgi:hypothetical protein|uniref:hypothetical protein n=1 Tax=Burkholderia pseudomallei TaxID=28450 RepID=UPI0024DFD68C|nr:hypothetical protein [Burkholderia pseudomallei]
MEINYPTNEQIVDVIDYNFNNCESTIVIFEFVTFYVFYNGYVKFRRHDDVVAVAVSIENLINYMESKQATRVC